MKWTKLSLGIIILLTISSLVTYWFIPTEDFQFKTETNSNFSLDNQTTNMQFYKNMRFKEKSISYRIDKDCTIEKKYNMRKAFDIIENQTIIDFYEVEKNEEIIINCEEKNKIEGDLFIAGEGGPTNITQGDNFNIIVEGQILLIRDSECQNPNIAIHELLHVLGFNHSDNSGNIMYPVSKCKQEIGDEIINEINRLYKTKSNPDLAIKNISVQTEGRYLNINISIFNNGLKESKQSNIIIYADKKEIKKIELKKIGIGEGVKLELSNILLTKTKIEEIKILIETEETELSLENNQILLTKT